MDNLTERLLGENFEEALKEMYLFTYPAIALAEAVRELHARLRIAKAEGAAAREDVALRPAPSTLEPPFVAEFDRHWEKYSILDSARSVLCNGMAATEAQWVCDALNSFARAGGGR